MAGLLKKLFSPAKPNVQKQTLADDGLPALDDSDFEFLLDQLLQGLAHGWQPDRVEVFMLDLGSRGKAEAWEKWLENFSAKILAQSRRTQQRQIGTRFIYISDALNHSQKMQRLSKVFSLYGQQLVTGQKETTLDAVWEYDGPDASPKVMAQIETTAETQPITPESIPELTPQTVSAPTAVETKQETVIQAKEPVAPVESEPAATTASVSPQNISLQERFNLGLAKADQGDFAGAIAEWDEVLKMNDQIPQVWHNRGSAFGCLGQFEAALECFDKSLAILPSSVVVCKDRSYALMKLERWEEALASWNQTIELRDNVAEAWFQRGCTLEQLEKFDNALINYRKAIALEPNFTQAQERLKYLEANPPAPTKPENTDPWA